MNFQSPFGRQFADETAFDNRFSDHRIGVQQITSFLDHQPAMGPEILGNSRVSSARLGLSMAAFRTGYFNRVLLGRRNRPSGAPRPRLIPLCIQDLANPLLTLSGCSRLPGELENTPCFFASAA